jgi:hypothetical protein
MANNKTGSQRYNDKIDKLFNNAIEKLQEHCNHTYHLVQDSFSMQKYHRECSNCGKKSATTKYKMSY